MNLRGQQFEIDLSHDEDHASAGSSIPSRGIPSISSPFVSDIKERETAPPSAPTIKNTSSGSGFPEHKKRPRVSAFKQQRAASVRPVPMDSPNAFAWRQTSKASDPSSPTQNNFSMDEDRRRIDQENMQRIAAMSPEQIAEERQELMSGLDPSLIQMLLKRSNLDQGRGDTGIDPPSSKAAAAQDEEAEEHERQPGEEWDCQHRGTDPAAHTNNSTPAPEPAGKRIDPAKSVRFTDDESEPPHPIGLQSVCTPSEPLPPGFQPSIHFPSAPSAPELDPSDPDFLSKLHSKVVETLEAAAGAEGGHQGSKAYAVEALWLWQKGGGEVVKAE
ncbi:transcription factor [Diplocarpon rosae]|nr:transcription factor [Diplocarpon rosae]